MSAGRILYLRCDFESPDVRFGGCGTWSLDQGIDADSLAELRKAARKKGWRRSQLGDFCPDHAAHAKRKKGSP